MLKIAIFIGHSKTFLLDLGGHGPVLPLPPYVLNYRLFGLFLMHSFYCTPRNIMSRYILKKCIFRKGQMLLTQTVMLGKKMHIQNQEPVAFTRTVLLNSQRIYRNLAHSKRRNVGKKLGEDCAHHTPMDTHHEFMLHMSILNHPMSYDSSQIVSQVDGRDSPFFYVVLTLFSSACFVSTPRLLADIVRPFVHRSTHALCSCLCGRFQTCAYVSCRSPTLRTHKLPSFWSLIPVWV